MNSFAQITKKKQRGNDNSSRELIELYKSPILNKMGGSNKKNNSPKNKSTGSFPPIYKISHQEIKKEKEEDKNRGFAKNKSIISIKDIINDRRNEDSFIEM
jgi:hypothetical protein